MIRLIEYQDTDRESCTLTFYENIIQNCQHRLGNYDHFSIHSKKLIIILMQTWAKEQKVWSSKAFEPIFPVATSLVQTELKIGSFVFLH